MINKECSKEKYEEELRVNWQTSYKTEFTPRDLLQYIGTDLFRNKLLNDVWVNALFNDYKNKWSNLNLARVNNNEITGEEYPNWIITDLRFPNELKAIKAKNGIAIRIIRNKVVNNSNHISETALDNAEFDYILDNNGNIEDLIENVRKMLIHFKIL